MANQATNNIVDMMDEIMTDSIQEGIIHHFTEDEAIAGSKITIDSHMMTNYASCSYLGLEQHSDLIEGTISAVQKYGTQFSSSRSFVSLGLYQQLESILGKMYQKPVLVSATTTLGHMSALPVLIKDNDAVIVDLQVHSSVQTATQLLKARGITINIIPHNNMHALEKTINKLKGQHDNIWYLADGVYSMYGDVAPMQELEALLNKYEQFHLYIDDAHGMSWAGKNGMGYVRSQIAHHDKMLLAVSLNKAFASAGGALVFPNKEMAQKVRNCGGTFIFSGPIQPPMLGAAIACAKIHYSDKITQYQNELAELVNYTNQRIKELGLPQVMFTDSPLFFIPVGLPKPTISLVKKLLEDGLYVNGAAFPATPMKRGGLRFTLNRHLTKADINRLLDRICYHFPQVCQQHDLSYDTIARNFSIAPFQVKSTVLIDNVIDFKSKNDLTVELNHSIAAIDKTEWDQLFSSRGNFTHSGMQLLENVFTQSDETENQWKFNYFIVRDRSGKIVLATMYTSVLLKDDMFAKADVSKVIEQYRKDDPMYLVSKAVMLGCPISKGQHLYLDKDNIVWKEAIKRLIEQMQITVTEENASRLMLGEFIQDEDPELKALMKELGLVEFRLPNTSKVEDMSWKNHDEYLASLGQKYRYNLRKEVLAYSDQFAVTTKKPESQAEMDVCYDLYSQVFERSYEMNVFKLPKNFFEAMCQHPDYDIIRLYLKGDVRPVAQQQPVAVMFSFVNQKNYSALIVGLDYQHLKLHNSYKQALYQTVQRAKELKMDSLDLAYTAEMEKKKVGAKPVAVCSYIQIMDHCNQAIIDGIAV